MTKTIFVTTDPVPRAPNRHGPMLIAEPARSFTDRYSRNRARSRALFDLVSEEAYYRLSNAAHVEVVTHEASFEDGLDEIEPRAGTVDSCGSWMHSRTTESSTRIRIARGTSSKYSSGGYVNVRSDGFERRGRAQAARNARGAMFAGPEWLAAPDDVRTGSSSSIDKSRVAAMSDGTPDLSGLWVQQSEPGYTMNITADLAADAVRPEARRAFTERMNEFGKDDPSMIGCLPMGPRHITSGGRRSKIIHTPGVMTMLFEDLAYRQIHLDGRLLPVDPHPSFMGYSVGRWEADTLVVETIGFNDRTWLDAGGHPHTDRLRVVERFRRINFGRIERQVTLIDPELYRDPIVLQIPLTFTPDTELLESVCAETPRSPLIGRTEEEKTVVVPPEVLRRYVGVYEVVGRADFGIARIDVTLSGGQLLVDLNGKGRIPLVPLSQTMFSPRLLGTYEFVADENGVITHLLAHATEGTFRFNRRRE